MKDRTMSILRENIDVYPYTGKRTISAGYLKVKENAEWLNGFFDGTPCYKQVIGVTRGKIYEVVAIEGHGDCEDVTIIDDNGNEQILGDFFFE